MENDYFDSALNSLKKPQEKRRLLQILVVIRKGVHDTSHNSERVKKLNDSGCIKNLIKCLQHENRNVLDIALSIMGNCCVDPHFARDSVKLNILHGLNRVLERQDEDSIQGRVFRIVGNLCDSVSSYTIIFKEPALIDKIVCFLRKTSETDTNETYADTISEASVTTALRSIRKLLRKSTLNKLVVKHEVLKAVGLVLIKYTRLWQATKEHEHILQDILRLLHVYSQYNQQLVLNAIAGLKRAGKGDPLECLAALVLLNPSRVIKIVLNLGRFCVLKSDLPIPGIWENLLTELKSISNDSLRKEYLKSLCDLVDDPANREYLRLQDNVVQLIEMVKSFTTCTDYAMECCSIILSILNKCHNDDLLVTKQIHYGSIAVLTDKLEWLCEKSGSIVVPNHSKRKRRKSSLPSYRDKKFKASTGSPNDTFPLYLDSPLCRDERSGSPSECSEISSNGPYSPSYAVVAEDVSDSDNYSPVCSDAEDTDLNFVTATGPLDADYVASSEDENSDRLPPDLNQRIKYRLLEEVTSLLIRYTRMRPVIMELANLKLLMLLMNISIECNEINCASLNVIATIASDRSVPERADCTRSGKQNDRIHTGAARGEFILSGAVAGLCRSLQISIVDTNERHTPHN